MHLSCCPCSPFTLRFALGAIAVIALTANPATASILWQWEYSGSAISASGTFLTVETPNENGGYLITAITGTRNGEVITGLQAPGTSIPGNEPYTVDDLVFLGRGSQLTSHGFGFALSGGNYSNPFYADFLSPPEYLEFFSTPPLPLGTPGSGSSELPVQFSAAPVSVPEPPTYALIFGTIALIKLRSPSRSFLPGSSFTPCHWLLLCHSMLTDQWESFRMMETGFSERVIFGLRAPPALAERVAAPPHRRKRP
jgi:hypothetical protein